MLRVALKPIILSVIMSNVNVLSVIMSNVYVLSVVVEKYAKCRR
jgi:hypothetical protein